MVKRVHNHCSRWGRNRYYYWVTTFARLADIHENGRTCHPLPLFMETFAFFFEAIFLSIYLYTWDRFKNKWTHFIISLPVIIGGSFSAFFITSVNSFMNTPAGFEMKHGRMVNVQPLEAMFNSSFLVRAFHVVATAGMTMAFILAAIAAFKLLRNRYSEDRQYHKKALKMTMIIGFLSTILSMVAGDLSAKFLHKVQPEKLVAMNGIMIRNHTLI